jgi:hypothetical protein
MRRKSHVRFGERDGETHLSQGRKVRPVPTLHLIIGANTFVSLNRRGLGFDGGES